MLNLGEILARSRRIMSRSHMMSHTQTQTHLRKRNWERMDVDASENANAGSQWNASSQGSLAKFYVPLLR
ncbi:hypothetical protein ARMGADRAFT_468605 [Armillaria gallica]|uniref:Uncharacterized protein n=1 Tax=Armillaria gallica TaxID=47427 RepID=A0A2H3D8L5_ARMGA|nr:hypothetical protein ARMGADRAFT_468605 [Armillaria gallica]